jgi:hypothetical protein
MFDNKEKLLDGIVPNIPPVEPTVSDDELRRIQNIEEAERSEEEKTLFTQYGKRVEKKRDDDTETPEQKEAKRVAEEAAAAATKKKADEEDDDDDILKDVTDEQLSAIAAKKDEELTDAEKAIAAAALAREDENKTLIESVIDADGYELDDAFVAELKKDGNSIASLNKYNKKVAQIEADRLINSNPIMAKLNQHLSNGGSFESFKEANTENPYTKIKIDDETEDSLLETIIKSDLKEKGVDDEDINDIIKAAKKSNRLSEKATKSQESLTSRDTERRKAIIGQEQERINGEKAQATAIKTEVSNMFKSNKFGNFSLPSSDLPQFKEAFFTEIDNQGTTVLDKKWDKLSTDQKVMLDYIVYNDFNLKGLMSNKKEIDLAMFRKKQNDKRNLDFKTKSVSSGGKMSDKDRSQLRNIKFN